MYYFNSIVFFTVISIISGIGSGAQTSVLSIVGIDFYIYNSFRLNYLLIGMAFSATISDIVIVQIGRGDIRINNKMNGDVTYG